MLPLLVIFCLTFEKEQYCYTILVMAYEFELIIKMKEVFVNLINIQKSGEEDYLILT